MGWKSTIDLTRQEALDIIGGTVFDALSDDALADLVEEIRGGVDHGHNYRIVRTDVNLDPEPVD